MKFAPVTSGLCPECGNGAYHSGSCSIGEGLLTPVMAIPAVPMPDLPSPISRDEKAALRAVQQLYRTLPKGSHPGQMGCIKITHTWRDVMDEKGNKVGHKKPITNANCTIRYYHSTSVDMDVE